MGVISSAAGLGMSFAPVLGGILIHHFSWRFIFLMSALIGLITLFLACFQIQTSTDTQKKSFDYVGALILILSLFSFTVALNQGMDWMA